MRDPLRERVDSFLRTHDLLRPDALLLVAVSGGPDSLCLLHLLSRIRPDGGPALHVAHIDHGVRGDQSRAEANQVAAIASAWGLAVTVAHYDVPALAAARRESLLAAARSARYRFLAQTAAAIGAHAVAVAHQADDQAETVLLHVLRGAGPAGLRGMRKITPWEEWAPETVDATPYNANERPPSLIRPLLATTRAEIEAYCAAHSLDPARDPSNTSSRYTRARVRQLLPLLAAENPRFVEALGRSARVCADDYAFIQAQLDAAWPALALAATDTVTLRREAWENLHPSLQRYALRRAAAILGQAELSLELVEDARALAARSGNTMALGAKLRLEADQRGLRLWRAGAPPPATGPQLTVAELALPIPGAVELGGGWTCVVGATAPAEQGPWWVALDAAALDGPLALRRRRAGDRFRPAGGRGTRLLQDFFVDRKVPRGQRDAWPILTTPEAIVWLPGLRADARFVARDATHVTIWVGFVHHKEPDDASRH